MSRERLDATVAARLRALGQRATPSRLALVAALAETGRPLTISEILSELSLPTSSAYRNLAVLEQAGVVHRVHTRDEFARYELVEDLSEHHHHLVCQSCGSVTDFQAPPGFERTVRRAAADAASAEGFTAQGHRLDLIGLCRRCA